MTDKQATKEEPQAVTEIKHIGDSGDGKVYQVIANYGYFMEREARDLQKYLTGREGE